MVELTVSPTHQKFRDRVKRFTRVDLLPSDEVQRVFVRDHTTGDPVAMARAAKIPSRVAIGLVSMRGAFYYHAWPEVFVGDAKSPADAKNGLWIPVDPTLNQFPADVSHVRLARGGFDRQAAILPLPGLAAAASGLPAAVSPQSRALKPSR